VARRHRTRLLYLAAYRAVLRRSVYHRAGPGRASDRRVLTPSMLRRKTRGADSPSLPLQPAECRELLRLARAAIGAALNAVAPPVLELSTPALHSVSGVFVSLHLERDLRGCVGSVTPTAPLHAEVMHMACAAAFEDPRFPPMTVEEWLRSAIEISRLSPPRPARPVARRRPVRRGRAADADEAGTSRS